LKRDDGDWFGDRTLSERTRLLRLLETHQDWCNYLFAQMPCLTRCPSPSSLSKTSTKGYYTRTRENRSLIGPLPIRGAYILGALAGYRLMAAPAAGEMLAAHITGASLPDFAASALSRYSDPVYLEGLKTWGTNGQLYPLADTSSGTGLPSTGLAQYGQTFQGKSISLPQ
ncbi:MAG: hypothetical protein NZM11_05255, partial [Anaerolineales bacterium]|nr:hypothetical protein [Anaerolineales bacterium]